MKLLLTEWAAKNYSPAPSLFTLRRWAREAGFSLTYKHDKPGTLVLPIAMFARFAALVREDVAADLAQALCDDCENGVKWLNEAAAAKFAKDYPHLRKALSALKEQP